MVKSPPQGVNRTPAHLAGDLPEKGHPKTTPGGATGQREHCLSARMHVSSEDPFHPSLPGSKTLLGEDRLKGLREALGGCAAFAPGSRGGGALEFPGRQRRSAGKYLGKHSGQIPCVKSASECLEM